MVTSFLTWSIRPSITPLAMARTIHTSVSSTLTCSTWEISDSSSSVFPWAAVASTSSLSLLMQAEKEISSSKIFGCFFWKPCKSLRSPLTKISSSWIRGALDFFKACTAGSWSTLSNWKIEGRVMASVTSLSACFSAALEDASSLDNKLTCFCRYSKASWRLSILRIWSAKVSSKDLCSSSVRLYEAIQSSRYSRNGSTKSNCFASPA
mmetsp:Transcript_21275/g.51467  ORF Transcript_21275/g.51467 Transcript_21275/m.51467 type:complete len:208 (+) Transcript_21275:243-866(+)